MRINSLILKDDTIVELPHKITVFVGPNNSGKSQTLKDIRCMMDKQQSPIKKPVILKEDYSCFTIPNLATIKKDVPHGNSIVNANNIFFETLGSNLFNKYSLEVQTLQIENFDSLGEDARLKMFFGWFGKYYIAVMDAESRLKLASETNSFVPSEERPSNLIQSLFVNNPKEENLKNAFKGAFQQDIKVDYSQLAKICLRVGDRVNEIPPDARTAYTIAKDIPKIDNQGDGYRSFAGIIIGLLTCTNRIILLDEPEAFLHPAQAFFLGKWIGEHQSEIGSQLLVCTHSSNFLSGILTGTQELSVIRLKRNGDKTSYNVLTSEIAKQLIGNPILSSQRVVDGIFHKGVVVCEADADRAVYQSVASIYHKSNREILFIHAHNKQSLALVAEVLKQTGTPVAVISDIDILRPDKDLNNVYKALTNSDMCQELKDKQKTLDEYIDSRPEDEVLEELKGKVEEYLNQLREGKHSLDGAKGALSRIQSETSKWSNIKRNGISSLEKGQDENALTLIKELSKIGLFVVPVGELEGWMELGTHKKNKWIIPALQKINEGRASKPLIKFVGDVLKYFEPGTVISAETSIVK